MTQASDLHCALDPTSIAIVGASDNPHKVGGRPILYMKRYGYRGAIYPINPARAEVQGLKAFPDLAALPVAPEMAIVAVAGDEAVRAVEACAARGVKVAVVMASGFGEVGAEGRALQDRMLAAARAAGMRMIGPNCQGIANLASGTIASFSTMFHEIAPQDGPVAIISQSGACAAAIYVLARQRGLAVRHAHATGNEADVTASDLALEVVRDPGVGLLLLYLEAIPNPAVLAEAAEEARARNVAIVAIKAGRTASGQKAASSHTGALASEDRVVDAFLAKHGIWRADDPHALVSAGHLYLKGWRPGSERIAVVSNSGASCVMAADAAEAFGLPLAEIPPATKEKMKSVLPGFATPVNPIDVTGALLTDSGMFERLLPVLAEGVDADLMLAALPIAGAGYDLPRYARNFAAHSATTGCAIAVAAPQAEVRREFEQAGLPTFEREREAMQALAQLARHAALLRVVPARAATAEPLPPLPTLEGDGGFLGEARSLALLAGAGIGVIGHRLCTSEAQAREAFAALGGPVALKACSPDAPHKTELGLVALGVTDADAVAREFARQQRALAARGARVEGVIVARMARKGRELALGARIDPQFGPVVMLGDGGIYLEALKDFVLLLPPFDAAEARAALARLRIAPLLAGVRGEPPRDLDAVARMAVRIGAAIVAWQDRVSSIDINPVMVYAAGEGAVALDALIETK
ncbi:MAG: acetate--CoA ligase family protein [Betaproteobacteria bacterium]|nr:acetate--CoA ligase family protein [Betaproteobacteria bacterium]